MAKAMAAQGYGLQTIKHNASAVNSDAYNNGKRDGKSIHYGEYVDDGRAKKQLNS